MGGIADVPFDDPAWRTLRVGGVPSPGICVLSEPKRKHTWDQKKGKGVKGGTLTFVGIELATFVATIRIWDDGSMGEDQRAEWEAWVPLLKYDPTKKQPQAVDVYHPALASIDLTSVVAEEIQPPLPVEWEGTQYWEAKISFIEYNPPPPIPAVGTPTGSQGQYIVVTGKTQVPQTPETDEQRLAALQQQLQQAQQQLP